MELRVLVLTKRHARFGNEIGKNTTWLDVSCYIYSQKKGFVEKLPVSFCVINCTNRFTDARGIIFFLDFLIVNQSGMLGSTYFVGRIRRRPSPRESALFSPCQV